ncbi:type VI secretion system protein TssA [Sedimentitalea nanhaiensis]|uniref:Type VI secretion system protein ImpA n=1 Tax=Sedimentitalea nanhaiensis TaxID=999627 RepID=A0A1I7D852_9RHOB|nr:type VI secretion system protein TssA [Sedimentitalea nanhaiensis]SFU07882.1 type VI secretion system protein ImpA [Sedimentitalea nanhaiensis]
MDPDVLLKIKGDESPSGENLEYDQTFTEMELAAQPVEEQQVGNSTNAGHDPDYREVVTKALEVLEKSHDLRAAVFLSDAILHTEGLTGFADATTVIRGHLEQFWETCHPELDEDDDNDPTMRVNAIQGLCGQPGGLAGAAPVYRSLNRAPVTDSRGFGRFSMRDIDISEGQIVLPDGETGPDTATIAAAFQDTDAETLTATMAAVQTAIQNVRAIAAVFDDKTPGQGPELDPLIKLLDRMAQQIGKYTVAPATAPEAGDPDGGLSGVASDDGVLPAPAAAPGEVNSRSDVSASLDRIVTYYRQNEPSSPIPILLERAKRLVNADFLTIMQDIAPGEVENVRMLGGVDKE